MVGMKSPSQPHRVETPHLSIHSFIYSPRRLPSAFYMSGTDLGSEKKAVLEK